MYHDYPWFCKAEVNIPNLTWAFFNSEEYCIYKLRLRKVDAVAFSKERIVLGTGLRSCGSHGSYVPWFFLGMDGRWCLSLYFTFRTVPDSCLAMKEWTSWKTWLFHFPSVVAVLGRFFLVFSMAQELWSERDESISGNHNFKAHS